MRFVGGWAIFMLLATTIGCSSSIVEDAFTAGEEAEKSNKTISEYCVTCHTHEDFDAENHVFDVKYRYDDPKYSGAKECRTCHTYTKTWLLDIRRGTHRPAVK